MNIKSKLSEQDFIRVSIILLYSRILIKIFTGMSVFYLIISILSLFSANPSFAQLFIPITLLSFLPIITYFNAKQNFKSDKRISEMIEYSFEDDFISIKGESFSSQLSWDKIYKITQTKNWLMIWHNSQIANVIPRGSISEVQFNNLKMMLIKQNVKNNL